MEPLGVLAEQQQAEHPDDAAPDRGPDAFGRNLAGDIRRIGWELDYRVVDGSEFVYVFVVLCVPVRLVVVVGILI